MKDKMLDAIYIHIPFCLNKCNYCDFLSFKSTEFERDRYINYLTSELSLYPKFSYKTIYFGGGTPSIMTPEQIDKVLTHLDIERDAEITLEVNPKTVDLEKLIDFKRVGINRVSIGIQSFNENHLKQLGRLHSSEEGKKTFYQAREAGFNNISLDLMFSLPNQSIEELKEDLKTLFSLRPEHFSIYSLIWEEGTNFFKLLESGRLKENSNDLEATMYEMIISEAKKNGYIHYEISNFSLPEKRSIHNTKYWQNREYLGIGLGASGYLKGIRYRNVLTFSDYYDKINSSIRPIFESETLTLEDKEIYEYILGLRVITDGIFPRGRYIKICEKLVEKGLLIKNGKNNYLLSNRGILIANDVFSEFI